MAGVGHTVEVQLVFFSARWHSKYIKTNRQIVVVTVGDLARILINHVCIVCSLISHMISVLVGEEEGKGTNNCLNSGVELKLEE